MNGLNRRGFMNKTTSALAGAALVSAARPARVAGANGRVNIASIGVRSQGMGDTKELVATDRVNIVAMCDVDSEVLESKTAEIAEKQGQRPKTYSDFRKVLEDKDVDAVLIATPDHWHTYIAIAACQAGKDVYIEKPCAQDIIECQLIADAAKKYKRVVQHGTQQRSGKHFQQARDYVKSGKLGKVAFVRNWGILGRGGIGKAEPSDPPANLDYDMWLGPAPKHAYTKNRSHYNWRFFWDYGTGDMGNWGVHWLDIALWTLDLGWPESVSSTGGMHIYDDDKETPDTQMTLYEYPGVTVSWELLMWARHGNDGRSVGTAFYGENGTLIVDRNGFDVIDKNGKDIIESIKPSNDMGLAHKHDFIDAIQNRTSPIADIENGHISAAVANMGNVSYLSGQKIRYNPQTRRLIDSTRNDLLLRQFRDPWQLPSI